VSQGPGAVRQAVVPPIVRDTLHGPSQPLDASARAFVEPRFGYDFSQVRVHSGLLARQSAREVRAAAYTLGQHVVFGDGGFRLASDDGRRLLAHELTHVVQQSAGTPVLQRAPAKDAPPPSSPMTEAEAEAWYRQMNVDEASADPAPRAEGDLDLSGQALEDSVQESLQQSLTPEAMHHQLLLRRAQPLGLTAYQAADPQALADIGKKIASIQTKIGANKARIAELKKLGSSSGNEIKKLSADVSAFEDEVSALTKARGRFPRASRFSRFGKGAPAGTGQITYAGIQVETAEGKRIALEFAETTSTGHAEEEIIHSIESKLTKAQLHGARVTVVGDQIVCGERCVPALRQFAERNGVESVDSFVFQRAQIARPGFIGPPELASPRTTLRTMTESKSVGLELIKREQPIYRRPPSGSGGAVTTGVESGAEHAATSAAPVAGSTSAASAEQKAVAGIEHAAADESPGVFSALAIGFVKGLKSITPAKVARFGKNMIKEGIKGFATAKAVEFIIGDSRLEEDLAALDAANHAPHNSLPEKVRQYEKEAIGFLPPEIAIPIAGNIRFMNPLNPDFLYEATLQEQQRNWEKFKADYGDSDDAAQLYNQMQKHADDVYNGLEPF
jgi:uncharacterized protein DUF4157